MVYSYDITHLNHEVAHGIETDGHYYFKPSTLMDAFGLATEPHEKATAIDLILTFNKELNALDCDLLRVGFVRLPEGSEPEGANVVGAWHAFTYTVQSRNFDNQPLLVTEAFVIEFPLLALAHTTASTWISAYKRRPHEAIRQVANGM